MQLQVLELAVEVLALGLRVVPLDALLVQLHEGEHLGVHGLAGSWLRWVALVHYSACRVCVTCFRSRLWDMPCNCPVGAAEVQLVICESQHVFII